MSQAHALPDPGSGRSAAPLAGEPPLAVVILAAGQGTRMRSRRSKVLHEIGGQPMLGYPLAVAEALDPARLCVVVGRDAEAVRRAFASRAEFVEQAEQRGTGHAVLQAEPALRHFSGHLLILYGDTPLLTRETLERMRARKRETGAALVLLSAPAPLPGRVVRDAAGRVERIVEVTDATPEELELEEGNTGVYLCDAELAWEALAQVDDDNEQGEIYLTDVVRFAVDGGRGVEALLLDGPDESLGVNDRAELAEAARVLRRRAVRALLEKGVTLEDPRHTYVEADVEVGRDSILGPGCVLRSGCRLGEAVQVGPGCVLEGAQVGDGARLGAYCVLGAGSVVAPGESLPAHSVRPVGPEAPKRKSAQGAKERAGGKGTRRKASEEKASDAKAGKKKATGKKASKKKTGKKAARKKTGADRSPGRGKKRGR